MYTDLLCPCCNLHLLLKHPFSCFCILCALRGQVCIYALLVGEFWLSFFLPCPPLIDIWTSNQHFHWLLWGEKKNLFPCMSTKLWIIQPLYLNILSMFLIHSTLNASVTSIYFIVLSSDPSMSQISATETCNNLEYTISVQ